MRNDVDTGFSTGVFAGGFCMADTSSYGVWVMRQGDGMPVMLPAFAYAGILLSNAIRGLFRRGKPATAAAAQKAAVPAPLPVSAAPTRPVSEDWAA
jgi:hypothetical protein